MANQKKRDINAGLLALGVFLLALVLAFPAFSQQGSDQLPSQGETLSTQSVVRDQLEAFKARDHERAYSHAAPNIRGYFDTVDKFTSMVSRGYDPIYNSEGHVFGRNTVINNEIYQEVIITDTAGKQWQAVYTLKQQEDGSWKITGVKLNPYKGASA